jgi:arginyl-tRNA synthetase
VNSALDILNERITAAMAKVTGRQDCAAIVRPATDPRFGDYQANGVMALAKQLKTNPRKLAEEVVAQLDLGDICEPPEVAGPGFINLRIKPPYIAGQLLRINGDKPDCLGIEKATEPQTVVVDFSSPNIAKQMHVGHLRSTIIGDCLCRLLEFLGHRVIRQNHIGDWGTQFGRAFLGLWHISMGKEHREPYYRKELADLRACVQDRDRLLALCQRICNRHAVDWRADKERELGDGERVFWPFVQRLLRGEEDLELEEIEGAYQYATQVAESATKSLLIPTRERDPETGKWREKLIPYESLPRHVTAMLQQGGDDNEQEKQVWRYLIGKTLRECNEIYHMLRVTLDDSHVRGESFYRRALGPMVKRLVREKIARESEDAVCVEIEGFKNKDGAPLPFMIQKSDGAHLYGTTDLHALRWRIRWLKADKIIYVTDARQALHFQMLFKVADMAKWAQGVELEHVMFGTVLGEDGKPFKTRSGDTVRLKDLLDEAVRRAKDIVEEKNPDLRPEGKAEIAQAVGIGAVKYADYSNNRTSDYVFSFDKMLAMDGNTAPYMQYAYARVKSIERKAESKGVNIQEELRGISDLNLGEPTELDLGKHLARYAETIESAAADYRPNYLTAYLYELAQKFSAFYTECPVLDAPPAKRPTRLLLCDLTARTIQHGLSRLLGIQVVEQM